MKEVSMRYPFSSRQLSIMLYSLVFLSIISCKNSNPVSASYVDTYNPSLTVPKGTTYSGNYFPLIPIPVTVSWSEVFPE